MKNITILGWFGCGNLGDDAILLNEINLLSEVFPDSKITVFSNSPVETQRNFPFITTEKLPPIAWYRLYKFLNVFYLTRVIRIFKNTDLFILGGGGFFSDRQFFAIGGWLRYCGLAKFYGAKVYGLGMGAGPFFHSYSKKLISSSSNFFDGIVVRDITSKKNLIDAGFSSLKVHESIDLAFLTDTIKIEKDNSIGFVIFKNDNSLVNGIKELLDGSNYNIKFIITDFLDLGVNQKILNSLVLLYPSRIKIIASHDLSLIIGEISKCDFIFSERLHGSILSFTQKVPFLNIFYHHKGEELANILSIKDFSISINDLKGINLLAYVNKKNKFKFIELDLATTKFKLRNIIGKSQ